MTRNLNGRPDTAKGIDRRTFLQTTSAGIASAALLGSQAMAQTAAPTRMLGSLEVSSVGLGCMLMAQVFGPAMPRSDAVALGRASVDRGCTFFDTAEMYGPFYSEEVVGEALQPVRDEVVIATKFGLFTYDQQTGEMIGGKPKTSRETIMLEPSSASITAASARFSAIITRPRGWRVMRPSLPYQRRLTP
ncbi:aldo/keto reductase, partial [Tropicimonas sp.]|uniref:aldo/keto reductase n=1 Tax=Tropicimonas sp. TaxID=2067044 RepID=UPI003A8778AC